jgi:hypothetical protein
VVSFFEGFYMIERISNYRIRKTYNVLNTNTGCITTHFIDTCIDVSSLLSWKFSGPPEAHRNSRRPKRPSSEDC